MVTVYLYIFSFLVQKYILTYCYFGGETIHCIKVFCWKIVFSSGIHCKRITNSTNSLGRVISTNDHGFTIDRSGLSSTAKSLLHIVDNGRF